MKRPANNDLIAITNDHFREPVALDEREVVLDRDAARVDLELFQQRHERQRPLNLERFAVEGDVHGSVLAGYSTPCKIERFCHFLYSTPR